MKNITFCFLYHGEETAQDCLGAVAPFIDNFTFQKVINVSPQVKALNQMIEQVETKYLVPLDADMILNPDAPKRIVSAIENNAEDWHSILFPLWDTFTNRKIYALKILRTELLKQNLFSDSRTPDIEHFSRLESAGYKAINYFEEQPIGKHVLKGKFFCYHKYKDVYLTLRTHNREWDSGVFLGGRTLKEKSKKHFDFFVFNRIMSDNEDYSWALAGMVDGITMPVESQSKNLSDNLPDTYNTAIDRYLAWYMKQNYIMS